MNDDDELRINLLPPSSKKLEKSYFEVLRLCCNTEVPLIENLLSQLDGVEQVTVIVPTKTVVVVHDHLLITPLQIVRALNQESLEANVRVYGEEKKGRKWPSIYTMACGLLLLVSFFRYFYEPLNWLALAATIVGLPRIIFKCIAAVRNVRIDVNVLALVAVGGTVAMGDFWESAVIVFLFTISEWLESRASHKATAVMSSLLNMAPQKAILAENGLVFDARDVELNTILAVKAGEVIPIDGVVVEGSCEVDEKSLTGEPFPVAKQDQSKVLAGTINLNGYIAVKTTALAEDCAVAKMANLVEQAQNSKSQTQRLIDSIAKYYTPAVVFLSIGIVAIPAALRIHDIKPWVHLALVILVSACPCGLILSTPIAIFCALTKAASTGLLIKGGDYLESLANVKITAFDKTGTITRGEFSIEDFRSVRKDISLNTLLYWVSSIESKSSHPMAEALVDFGRSNSIEPKPESVSEFHNFPGEGICGEIDGKLIYVGNKRIALRAGCQGVPHVEGATVGYIFLGPEHIGTFSLVDSCRTGAAEAINQLKSLGIKTAILTGDSYTAAMRVQNQLEHAIDVVHADLLPEEKVNIIKELKKEGPTVMIGDGINDAPALATADIGISMGISGSALATESGHITLMSNDLKKIPEAIRLAIETRRKIIENVCLSIVTKAAIIALAISGHPLLWAAVLVDVGTCLLVIFNSMLILRGVTTSTPGEKCEARAIRSSGFVGGSSSAYHVTLNCSDELAAGDGSPGACSNRVKQRCCSVGDKPRTDDAKKEKKCAAKQSCCSVGDKPRTDDAKKEKECAVKRSCCSVDEKPRTDDAKKEKCSAKQSCCSVGDKPKTDDAKKEKECGAKQKCCSVGDKPRTDDAKDEKEFAAKQRCCSVGDKPRTDDAKKEKECAVKQRCCSVGDKPRTDDAKEEKECAAKQRCCSVGDKPRTDDAKSEKGCAAKQSCCSLGDRPRTDDVQKEKECASYVIQIMSNDTNEVENSRCQSNVATKAKCCDSNVATKTRCCDSGVTTKARCCDSSVATKTRCLKPVFPVS